MKKYKSGKENKKMKTRQEELTLDDYFEFLKLFNYYKEECMKKSEDVVGSKRYYLGVTDRRVSIEKKSGGTEVFPILGYFNNLRDCKRAKEMFQNTILEFDKYGFWGVGTELTGICRKITVAAAIFNIKRDIGDYRYYIVNKDGELDVKPVKFYKNLITKFGIFFNEEDCRKIIDIYREDLLNYIKIDEYDN